MTGIDERNVSCKRLIKVRALRHDALKCVTAWYQFLKKNRPCDIACWNHSHKNSNVPCSVIYDYSGTNNVTHYGGTEIADIIVD